MTAIALCCRRIIQKVGSCFVWWDWGNEIPHTVIPTSDYLQKEGSMKRKKPLCWCWWRSCDCVVSLCFWQIAKSAAPAAIVLAASTSIHSSVNPAKNTLNWLWGMVWCANVFWMSYKPGKFVSRRFRPMIKVVSRTTIVFPPSAVVALRFHSFDHRLAGTTSTLVVPTRLHISRRRKTASRRLSSVKSLPSPTRMTEISGMISRLPTSSRTICSAVSSSVWPSRKVFLILSCVKWICEVQALHFFHMCREKHTCTSLHQ